MSSDPAPSCTTTSSLVDTPTVSCDPDSEVSDNHSDTEESDDDECDTEFLTPDQRVFSGLNMSRQSRRMKFIKRDEIFSKLISSFNLSYK